MFDKPRRGTNIVRFVLIFETQQKRKPTSVWEKSEIEE